MSTAPAPTPDRSAVLRAVMDPRRLPTPPAVALQVVAAASRPECDPDEIVALLGMDPALSAKLLRAVNSSLYGRNRPITSLGRAVTVLGLGAVRSLVLGVSVPAARSGPADARARATQISSVAGALIAYDLSARRPKAAPADDMLAGLLRDIGAVLLQQTYPDAWRGMTERWGDRLLAEACEAEAQTFGVDHADVSAELLGTWKLPPEIVEPIRCHHDPSRLAAAPAGQMARAELLYFAGLLANLDTVVRHPAVLEYVLEVARTRYDLPQPALVKFMTGLLPKIAEFGALLNRDVRDCPDFAAVLSAGSREMETLNGPPDATTPPPPADAWARRPTLHESSHPTRAVEEPNGPPPFHPAFLDDFPAAGCRLGEYELRGVLGRGAMGVVFRAWDPSLQRPVAVKMMADAGADPAARERFAREAQACAAIRHPNVVTVYAVRAVGGLPYLAMELVEGVPLDRVIERDHPLPPATVARLGVQIARGLAAAHKKGIVHRDIKPANVLLEAETGVAKIADFGLARSGAEAKRSGQGLMSGTPHFMAPEQVHGQAATPATDLFSLGGLLYALCTGQPPFAGRAVMAILYAVCSAAPVPPRQLRPDLPVWLERVVLQLLDKDPARRFASAADAAAALTAGLK